MVVVLSDQTAAFGWGHGREGWCEWTGRGGPHGDDGERTCGMDI